jgi:hypothetical protein
MALTIKHERHQTMASTIKHSRHQAHQAMASTIKQWSTSSNGFVDQTIAVPTNPSNRNIPPFE